MADELLAPDFEIDHPEIFAQFLLGNRLEILFYLNLLAKRRCLFTAYIDDGRRFFLTSIVAVDEPTNTLFLDPSHAEENNADAGAARQITLVTNLDRVKMQIRLPALCGVPHQGQQVLAAPIPTQLLRLQRREFFRLEPPLAAPIVCQLATPKDSGQFHSFELTLSDISGGGVSLIGPTEIAEHFPRDALFPQCRLEIPDEGVIQVNLRVRKTVEISARDGQHSLRIGCEFVSLPGSRLAFIERYITRIERERKARDSGLVA
jgi:c-di-GMP-binding flagellar brake protein YcgR